MTTGKSRVNGNQEKDGAYTFAFTQIKSHFHIPKLTISSLAIRSIAPFIKNAVVFIAIIPTTIWLLLACASVSYNTQAQADIKLMKRYDAISDILMGQIERVNMALALDAENTDLVVRRENLLVRKMEVDQIREQARKSAIENADKGAKSSPLNGF